MKNFRNKARMKTLKAAFLTAIVLTVLLTAIGDVYGQESEVSDAIPMMRSTSTDVAPEGEL